MREVLACRTPLRLTFEIALVKVKRLEVLTLACTRLRRLEVLFMRPIPAAFMTRMVPLRMLLAVIMMRPKCMLDVVESGVI